MKSTSFELINFVRKITEGSRVKMLGASVISGASRGMVLATINTTAANTFAQDDNSLYILYFLFFTAVYIASCYYVRVNSVAIVEKAKKKLTLELTGKMILAELGFLERFTKSEIFQRVRMDVNNICGIANTMLESMQSAILLVFCLIYIAWLVPVALLLAIQYQGNLYGPMSLTTQGNPTLLSGTTLPEMAAQIYVDGEITKRSSTPVRILTFG